MTAALVTPGSIPRLRHTGPWPAAGAVSLAGCRRSAVGRHSNPAGLETSLTGLLAALRGPWWPLTGAVPGTVPEPGRTRLLVRAAGTAAAAGWSVKGETRLTRPQRSTPDGLLWHMDPDRSHGDPDRSHSGLRPESRAVPNSEPRVMPDPDRSHAGPRPEESCRIQIGVMAVSDRRSHAGLRRR